jgi:hypothetical protein
MISAFLLKNPLKLLVQIGLGSLVEEEARSSIFFIIKIFNHN